MVALVFLSHPIQTQSVNYIVQRMTLLAAFFFFSGALTYLKARVCFFMNHKKKSILYYLLTILLFYLATFSKQNAIVLPIVLLLIEILFIRNQDGKPAKKWIGFLSMSLLLLGLIVLIGGYIPKENDIISREAYFATQMKVVFKYLQLLIFPVSLNFDPYIGISEQLLGWKEILALIGHLIILSLGVLAYKKERLITFGIFWFYISLLIESSIIPIRDVYFEHRLYLPSYGFFLVLLTIIYRFLSSRKISILYSSLGVSILIIIFSIMSHHRNKVWEDDFSLWYDVVSKPPVKARSLQYLSAEYVKNKDFKKALQLLDQTLEIDSSIAQIHINKAVIYQRINSIQAAINEISIAIQIEPDNASYYADRAQLYMNTGNFENSKNDLLKAQELVPNDITTLFRLGVFYLKVQDNEKALEVLTRALVFKPKYIDARLNRGVAYMRNNQYKKAIYDFTLVLKDDQQNSFALNKRASSYFSIKKYSKAIRDYSSLIKINPTNGRNYKNRALSRIRKNQFNKALKDMELAKKHGEKIEPDIYDYLLKMKKPGKGKPNS